MRRRIVLLVLATTSAVVVGFLVPMCLLVLGLANDRAESLAISQAQVVAGLLGTVPDGTALDEAIAELSATGPDVQVVHADNGGDPEPVLPDAVAAAVRQVRAERSSRTVESDAGLSAVVPVTTMHGLRVVVATVPPDQVRQGVGAAWAAIAGLGALLIGGSVLLAARLSKVVSTPVTDVAAVAHRLREGDLTARAPIAGPDETVELATSLNSLAERIEGLLAAERERVADLGHRLRTPVTALRLDADLVDDSEVADRLREHVDQLQRSIDHLVKDARRTVRDPVAARCDAAAVVANRVQWWTPLAEDQGRDLVLRQGASPRPLPVSIGSTALTEVIDCLIDNVFAHTPEGAPIAVSVTGEDAWVVLSVEDGGGGTDAANLERGRSGSGSSGLGLSIVRRVVESAGGSVTLGASALGGLRVDARCPAAS